MDWNVVHASPENVDDSAEAYVLNKLAPAEADSYEEHLLFCERCRQSVQATDEVVQALRLASQDIDPVTLEQAVRLRRAGPR